MYEKGTIFVTTLLVLSFIWKEENETQVYMTSNGKRDRQHLDF